MHNNGAIKKLYFVVSKISPVEHRHNFNHGNGQRWSRGHKARGQGQEHKKIRGQGQPFRGQTLSRPRTKDTSASALQKKKKGLHKNFSGDLPKKKKKVFSKNFRAISIKKRFPKNFSSASQNFNIPKNSAVLEPRTSKCVLEDSTSGNGLDQYNSERR